MGGEVDWERGEVREQGNQHMQQTSSKCISPVAKQKNERVGRGRNSGVGKGRRRNETRAGRGGALSNSYRVAPHLCPLFAQGAFAQVLLAGCQDEVLQLTHLARSCACLATNTNTSANAHTHTEAHIHIQTHTQYGVGDDDEWPLEDNFA